MAALSAPQLLKLDDGEFDDKIKDMSVKGLLETIGVLQKEMSREQESFNTLSAELSNLKKNSGQYKSISKEMTASQAKLTLLMNRSMKCFSQQGNQQSKSVVEKRSSFHETQKPGTVPNRTSEPVNPTIVTESKNTDDKSVRNSENVPMKKTMVQVQSLKSNEPVLEINGSNGVNGETGKEVRTTLEKNFADRFNIDTLTENSTGDRRKSQLQNPSSTLGPLADQRNKFLSKSSDNVYKKVDEPVTQKPDVVKGKAPVKPTSVVMNADKQMMDLDSFTERKNMLNELKKFDKVLKPSAGSTHTEKVTEVRVNVAKSGDKRSSANVDMETETSQVEQKVKIFGDIKLGKKPSALKQTKQVIRKDEHAGNGQMETEKSINEPQNDTQMKLFDDLLQGVEENSENSSEGSPRDAGEVETTKDTFISVSSAMSATREVDIAASNAVTKVDDWKDDGLEEEEDTDSESSHGSEEEDKFVTEFHFSGTQMKAPATSTVATKQDVLQNSSVVPKVSSSSQQAPPVRAPQGQGQPATAVKAPQGQGQPETAVVSGGSGSHISPTNKDGEELVVDTKVKFREWDPAKLLAKLYEVKMMPDNVEDISHKFIGMEGLMEKLPMNKKKATLLKTWKRRFFRAQDGWLHYYESGNKDKPSDSLQLMGGKVEELGPRVLGVDDGRGKYLMVRVPTDHEYGLWKVALESQTADNVKATYVRPAPASIPHPKKKVVVIDVGSCSIRAGILGERATLPQVFFPSIVAVNKQTGDIVVGPDALKPDVRTHSNILQPIQPTNKVDKFNIDMAVMTEVLKKVFRDLHVDQSQYLVMLSTPQNLGDKLKEGLMRVLVDDLHVRGVCMVQQSLLALYSYNATSGIIVDIGERLEILPIYDGLLIEGGVSRQAYGGTKIQDSLHISLLENKYQFNTPVEKLFVRYICEQACYVTDNYPATKERCDKDPDSFTRLVDCTPFNLPEGAYQTVSIDYASFKSPEGFFNTDLWEMDYKNIQKQIYAAIQQCPMDARKHMYRSVYLSGGVTTIPGFAERLQVELRKLAPPAAVVEVHASPQRYHCAYIGACAVAGMDVFEMSCVSADEWKKLGVKACKKWGTG